MKIGLVGWGVETKSAYAYFGPDHHYVIFSEEPRDDFPTGSHIEVHSLANKRSVGLAGNVSDLSYLDDAESCDLVVITPPARKNLERHFVENDPVWSKITDAQRIFFENSPTKNIIGITGTKGKGTTSTLIYEMLKAGGKDVYLGGNIGVCPLDFIHDLTPDSWVVLELSSFQLYKFPYSPHIAVHLMMMPEHIEEWHKTMDDYVMSKRSLVAHQTVDDYVVYAPFNEYSALNVSFSSGSHIPYCKAPGARVENDQIVVADTVICSVADVKLLGKHNLENICAAITAVWIVYQDSEALSSVVRTFSGLEHRLELAGEINGVRYYDDSFGTTPDTAVVAMESFAEPKVMIVGGHDKGNDMSNMCARLCGDDIQHVIFIGTIANNLRDACLRMGMNASKTSYMHDGNSWTMREIVAEAQKKAQAGDVVLLSCGTSSFGIFKDYKDRGNQFKQAVSEAQKLSEQ